MPNPGQTSFDHSRIKEILETSMSIAEKSGKVEKFPLEAQAIALLAFKAELISTFGRDALDVLPSLNMTAAVLCPELLRDNLPLYHRMERVFFADLKDIGL